MTARELRSILYQVTNQELTVAELRHILFELEAQDEELTDIMVMQITRKQEEN